MSVAVISFGMFRMYRISGRSETWNGGLFGLFGLSFDFWGLDRWGGVGFVEAGGAGASSATAPAFLRSKTGQDAEPLMGEFVCNESSLGAVGRTAIGSSTSVEDVRDPRSNLISLCSSDSCNLKATFSLSSSLTLVAAKRRAARQFGHIQVSPSQFVIISQHCTDDPEHAMWYHSPQMSHSRAWSLPQTRVWQLPHGTSSDTEVVDIAQYDKWRKV